MAVETVDLQLARLMRRRRALFGVLVVTADHGNADEMVERDQDGRPQRKPDGTLVARTSHTTNPVGFWLYRPGLPRPALRSYLPDAGLANVAATVLELLGFKPPADYLPSLLA